MAKRRYTTPDSIRSERERRDQQATEQAHLIDRMCADLNMSQSGLARKAGVHNSTITRYRSLGKPNKWDTIAKLIDAYTQMMKERELPIPAIVSEYIGEARNEKGDLVSDEFTPERLKLALNVIVDILEIKISDEDVQDIVEYMSALYPVIVEEEDRTGGKLPDDPVTRARIKREWMRRLTARPPIAD